MITLDYVAQGVGGIVGETPWRETGGGPGARNRKEASIPRMSRPPPKTNRWNFSMVYQQNLAYPQDIPPLVPSEAGNKPGPDGVLGSKQKDPGRR